ncbi:MAG: hypothetical protein NTW21_17075 [Verrucomicrobia bacterium]|nr:hypothetical protein [Verrucomicrobiota bacterium]
MNESNRQQEPVTVAETLARMERRLARVELMLGLEQVPESEPVPPGKPVVGVGSLPVVGEFEVAVGQHLFANIGIVVLAIGGALALSLPWQGWPRSLPSVVGWLLAGGLFLLARWLQQSLPLIGKLCRGAGMALLFFATLRLCYFGAPSLLDPASVAAAACLSLAVAVNLAIGWWRKSVWLTGLAMVTGYAAALAVGTPWYVLGMVTGLSLVAGLALRKLDWPWLVVFATPCAFVTYLLWALGNRLEEVASPFAGVCLLLVWIVMHGLAMTGRQEHTTEGPVAQAGSFLNCGGYFLFLLHTFLGYREAFFAANVAASLVMLGMAVMFWVRERSRFATFVYAMTGYAALNMALIKATEVPELFVWLSAQSLLVVTTAIWFRSRFIIVANFLIYLAVVACYMVLVQQENGISLVFGVVALTSSRILKWQKNRLELKTELMRNAYLTSAFIVLPYAIYHIVPQAWVALSWVGIALFYYVMNLLTKARKYRWMGHNTLLLTVVYILITSIGRLAGTQRILSFLVLGTVLMVVSLVFTMIRTRQRRSEAEAKAAEGGTPPADA